MSADNIMGTIL